MKLGVKWLVLMAGSVALCAVAAATQNPYQGIVERNVFGLKPPPAPPDLDSIKPPAPKITLTGITTVMGKKRALMKLTPPARPGEQPKEEAYTLAEGEREGSLEVLEIDEKAGTVKVNNYGTVTTLDFDNNGIKAPSGGAPVAAQPPAVQPRPALPLPGPNFGRPGAPPIPSRQLRMPGAGAATMPQSSSQGALSATPQLAGGTGLPMANGGVNPSVPAPGAAPEASPDPETSLFLLEVNRIKYQPLVDAGQWPPLPPGSDEMRQAVLASGVVGTPSPSPNTTPTPATTLPLPPGGAQPFPSQAPQ